MKFSELQRLQRREGITVLSSDARIEQLEARLCTITKERDALQAKIEQMESQQPAGSVESLFDEYVILVNNFDRAAPVYLAPGAKGEEK